MNPINFEYVLIVLGAQGLLDAFDSFCNHESKERLPSKPSAMVEQRLHSYREFIYAFVFLSLAWTAFWR